MSFTFWIVLNIQRNEPFFCVLLLRFPSRPQVHKEIVSLEASYFGLRYPKNIPLIYLNNNIITAYPLKFSFYREFQSSLVEVISFAKFTSLFEKKEKELGSQLIIIRFLRDSM